MKKTEVDIIELTLIFKVGKCFINALHKTATYTWSIFSKQNLEVFKIEN